MELVFLSDMQLSFASNWQRVANTAGVKDITIGDRFREQGFGPGAEELEVAGIELSPIGGLSRLFFNRGANATKPDVHRLGCVFEQVGIKPAAVDPAYQPPRETINGTDALVIAAEATVDDSERMIAALPPDQRLGPPWAGIPPELGPGLETVPPVKRGRGRPPGSKNKKTEEIKLPVGFA
jgi:hypothetical protein